MKKTQDLLASYASYHTKPYTKFSHFIGIPLITLSLFIALNDLPTFFGISWGWIVLLLVSVYYISLNKIIGTGLLFVFVLLNLLGEYLIAGSSTFHTIVLFSGLFFIGWLIQLSGHYVEGNRPAFFDNTLQLLTGPFFLGAEVAKFFGYKKFF